MKKFIGKNIYVNAGSFYFIGNVLNKGIVFLTIPIFTRFLKPNEYGVFSTYTSWVAIFTVLVSLGLTNTIRNAYLDMESELEKYISSILSLTLIWSIILILAFTNNGLIFDGISKILIILAIIHSYFIFVTELISVKLMMSYDYLKRTFIMIMPNILGITISVFLLVTTDIDRVIARILPTVIILLFVSLAILIRYFYKGKVFISKKMWNYGLKISLPLIVHTLSIIILSSSDRIMITYFRGSEETGLYGLVYSMSMIIQSVAISIESIWIPWVAKKIDIKEYDKINKVANMYIGLIAIFTITFLLVAPEILVIMTPEEYWGGKILLGPIIISAFIVSLYSLPVNIEYHFKSTSIIARNTVVAAIINLVLNYIFIPKYGAVAAAYTTLIAYLISFILHHISAKKLIRELFSFKIYFPYLILNLIFLFFSSIAVEYRGLRWSLVFIVITVSIIANKKKWRSLYEKRT